MNILTLGPSPFLNSEVANISTAKSSMRKSSQLRNAWREILRNFAVYLYFPKIKKREKYRNAAAETLACVQSRQALNRIPVVYRGAGWAPVETARHRFTIARVIYIVLKLANALIQDETIAKLYNI